MEGIVVWVVCGLFAASMVCDLRRRRIPNAIQLALLGLFAVYAATGAAGPPGVLWVHLAIGAVLLAAGFARTIVEDVRVVAIDRQVGSGVDSPGGGEDGEIVRTKNGDRNPGSLAGARRSPGARRALRQALSGGPLSRRRLPKPVEVLVNRLIRDVGIVPADLAAGAERALRARAITPR